MYFHSLKYGLLTMLRSKEQLFWCFMFPIVLATMFHFAFSGLASDESFSAIPVAVVLEDNADTAALTKTLDTLGEPGEDQFLSITYATREEALSLLQKKEIIGILYGGDSLTLSVSTEMHSMHLEQSILRVFVEQFNLSYQGIIDIAKTHPENLADAVKTITRETNYLTDSSFTEGNISEALSYFYNLIAMTCLYAAMLGNNIAIANQANLSELGARRNISPVSHFIAILGDITAALIFQFASVSISIAYMHFILDVDFGNQTGYVLLASLVGCLTGITLGLFIGSIGRWTKETKFGILMAAIMLNCMFSGLMMGNIRIYVEQIFPIYNYINPAALISDAFYSLIIYPSHERYCTNILLLVGLCVLFSLGSLLQIRRKKYASL